MFDFSTVRGVTIPDGNVKKILSGNVLLWNKSRVPDGYTELDAIICYGGQWIDTGIVMDSNDEMSIDADISDLTEPTFLIMGSRGGFQDRNISFSKQSAGYGITCDFNNGDGNAYRFNTDNYTTGRYKLFCSKTKRGIVGIGENTTVCPDTFTCPSSCAVGFWGAGYSSSNIGIIGIIYDAEIKNKWHGIPCMRNSDFEIGMWDEVGERFCPNAGIGMLGGKFKTFFEGYTQLRGIQATGQQWFDLGFKASNKHRSDINIRPTARETPNAQIWFGCYDGTVNYYMGPGGSQNWDIYFANAQNNLKIPGTITSYPKMKSCQAGPTTNNSTFYVWPDTLAIPKKTFETGYDIWMFNRSSTNGQYSNLPTQGTFYTGRFKQGITPVRILYPSLRQSDNVAGILDIAHNVFYRSMTGTDFVPIYF